MKKRLSRKEWLLFVLPVLLFVSLVGVHQWQQSQLYRDYVVNPMTGQYDPVLESWMSPMTRVDGDTVSIELGDYGEGTEETKRTVSLLLSPTLRMHREVKTFGVSWIHICCTDCGTSDGGQELFYKRDVGQVLYHSKGFSAGIPYNSTTVVATGVDDAHIHTVVGQGEGYDKL